MGRLPLDRKVNVWLATHVCYLQIELSSTHLEMIILNKHINAWQFTMLPGSCHFVHIVVEGTNLSSLLQESVCVNIMHIIMRTTCGNLVIH